MKDGSLLSADLKLAGRAFGAFMGIRDAFVFPLSPPPIPELGRANGFAMRLQDRGGAGRGSPGRTMAGP